MNFFELEIAKYERRVARIERDPSPTMLRSNKLLYQALLEHNQEQLRWWRDGKPFVEANLGTTMLIRAFGDFMHLGFIRIADRLGMEHAERCFDKIRALGLPDYACDRTILFLPMAAEGMELPRPQLIVAHSGHCQVIHDSYRTAAHLMGVPVYTIDVPFEDPYQENLDYVVAQVEGLIEFVESHLPGARFDEGKLVELQQLERRCFQALHEIHELRKSVPCPDHPRDVFREVLWPHEYANPAMLVEYYESYRDELRSRVERGYTPVGEEKLRIVWAISGPYGSNVWDFLAERGVSVPYWHYGVSPRCFFKPIYGDTSEFGKRLSPIEEEARIMLHNSWGGSGERWISETILNCQEFQADGLVLFEQTGCMPVQGISQILAERLEAELGVPAWRVEGRQLLGRSQRTEAEFQAGLEAFINRCFEKKRGR